MTAEEYTPSLFDSLLVLAVGAYLIAWALGMVVQFLVIRGFRRHGIQEFAIPFYRWGPSDTHRLWGFLYRRDYESRADIPPELARRCAQMRALCVALISLLALPASMIVARIFWSIVHR